ncbi:helix-turn-helix domain-containing protein [Candidatus Odyssella thessalonicensis]|uniref:helix-turn-helix domain-containing protein n=1 Tax=Candidatus Odyssella thessalonicensis TaxID=84647 RepID=UPI000225ACDA|nr:helix-turn-helix transcriptional regulator [Candidatus Odyssella thessalonicensis]
MTKIIVKKLANLIESAHMTPADLERRAGLSVSAVRNILIGRSKNPTMETLLAIANTLGCTVDELVRDQPPSIPEPQSLQMNEQHPWVKRLAIDTIEFVDHYLNSKGYTPSFEEILFFIREIYTFSLGTEEKLVDKRFGEWFIKKNLQKALSQ